MTEPLALDGRKTGHDIVESGTGGCDRVGLRRQRGTAAERHRGLVMIEAERFQDIGGWTIDAQFRQQMGSTYLIAAGTGEPVQDAVTRIRLPAAGRWRLWVRCQDWDPTSLGRFQVQVGEWVSPVTFGEQKRDWAWIDGGSAELPAGELTLRLHDLTGYYGRCDALLFSADPAFEPPAEGPALAALREELTGPYPVTTQRFDFVVVGGGYGGICAAVQAARLGLRTALVQNRPVLGGNASREIRVDPGGAGGRALPFREPGINEEIAEAFLQSDGDWSTAADRVVEATEGLTVFLETEGMRAVMDGRRIVAVEAEDVVTGARYRFEAPLFADCTGDGTIAFTAGCAFRHGEEARSEHGESRAPEQATSHTMGTSIIHRSIRMPEPQPYTPPPFAVKFSAGHFTHRRQNLINGTWWIEYGGLRDTIADAEHIRDELLRVIFGAFDWAKNHDPVHREANTHYRLAPVPIVGGKRESRRFYGDYVLNQNDVENGRVFEDAVAYGGWPIDIHPSPGIYGKDIPPAIFTHLKQPYTIPYRCLYARDADNLFLAGRHVSVTHVALGSTRLIQTIGMMGQAVGAAARLCFDRGIGPRGLYPDHIRAVQRILLKWDGWLPGIEADDPANLCRGARVTASSELPDRWVDVLHIVGADSKPAPMTTDRAMDIAAPTSGVRRIELRLAADGPTPVTADLELAAENREPLRSAATVAPGDFRWVAFDLSEELEAHRVYQLRLKKAPGLVWSFTDRARSRRRYGSPDKWTEARGAYLARPVGVPLFVRGATAAAAVDGWGVPDGEWARQWRSDPERGLPQWIEIDFGREVEFNTIHLVWDTNIFGRFPSPDPGGAVTATGYRILAGTAGGTWNPIVEEKGNRRRFRRHVVSATVARRIRLEVLGATGGRQARLYEIGVYREP